jgi:hypothetical protein
MLVAACRPEFETSLSNHKVWQIPLYNKYFGYNFTTIGQSWHHGWTGVPS